MALCEVALASQVMAAWCRPPLACIRNYRDWQSIAVHKGGSIAWAYDSIMAKWDRRLFTNSKGKGTHTHNMEHCVCLQVTCKVNVRFTMSFL